MLKKLIQTSVLLFISLPLFAEKFELNMPVTTNDHYNGVIVEIRNNDIVLIKLTDPYYEGVRLEYPTRHIYRTEPCLYGFCEGEAVTTVDLYNAQVKQVFNDGKVLVQLTDARYAGITLEYPLRHITKK